MKDLNLSRNLQKPILVPLRDEFRITSPTTHPFRYLASDFPGFPSVQFAHLRSREGLRFSHPDLRDFSFRYLRAFCTRPVLKVTD